MPKKSTTIEVLDVSEIILTDEPASCSCNLFADLEQRSLTSNGS